MKANLQHARQGSVLATPQNEDDLWLLYQLINKGDTVKARTFRKIKVGGENDRSTKVVRKPMTLTLEVEKSEFLGSSLRVLGTIIDGPEDISRAEYHSFSVEVDQDLTINKEAWPHFAINKIKDAIEEQSAQVLALVVDRDEATLAKITNHNYAILTSLKGNMPKKVEASQVTSNFYGEIAKVLQEYLSRGIFKTLIVGSAPFWQPYIKKSLDSVSPKPTVIYCNVQDASQKGIQELLKRPELQSAMKSSRFAQEAELVEKFLQDLATQKPVAYGIEDCAQAIGSGAVQTLLVSEEFLAKKREEDDAHSLESLLIQADQFKATIHFIGRHESGKKIFGLGGVVAQLRYAV